MSNTHRRLIRWRNKGVWEKLLEVLIDDSDYEWLMIDASHCKVHPHAAGAKGGNQSMSCTKRGSTQNCILPRHGMPVRAIITKWIKADCSQPSHLTAGLTANQLLADRGYDSDAIVKRAESQGMQVVIPPRKNRKNSRQYDKDLYRSKHLVENAFLHLKLWREIATRYAKNTASFLSAARIKCIAI